MVPRSSKARLLALFITAHLDESHTHKSAPFELMAGYVAPEANWAILDYDWKELLGEFGIPHFHAVEMENRRGPFKKWNDAREQAFRRRGRAVCRANTICSVSAAVDRQAHRWFRSEIKALVKKYSPDSVYGECFHQCMILCCALVATKYPGEKVSFLLATGHANLTNAIRIFQRNKHRPKFSQTAPYLHAMAIAPAELSSLQAADFFANETMRDVLAGRFKSSQTVLGRQLRALCDQAFFRDKMIPGILEAQKKMRDHAEARLRASRERREADALSRPAS